MIDAFPRLLALMADCEKELVRLESVRHEAALATTRQTLVMLAIHLDTRQLHCDARVATQVEQLKAKRRMESDVTERAQDQRLGDPTVGLGRYPHESPADYHRRRARDTGRRETASQDSECLIRGGNCLNLSFCSGHLVCLKEWGWVR